MEKVEVGLHAISSKTGCFSHELVHGIKQCISVSGLNYQNMFRLDYISCVLTVLSTMLVGKKLWHGWIVAGVNSLLICIIGMRTAQFGFIPANVFCIALYSYNLWTWRKCAPAGVS